MTRRPPHIRKARTLRRWMTRPEDLLWQSLRGRQLHGLKFRRKAPVGDRIADFLCVEAALIVEVTGPAQHRTLLAQKDAGLIALGYGVIRLRNAEVLEDFPDVLARIGRAAQGRLPAARRGA